MEALGQPSSAPPLNFFRFMRCIYNVQHMWCRIRVLNYDIGTLRLRKKNSRAQFSSLGPVRLGRWPGIECLDRKTKGKRSATCLRRPATVCGQIFKDIKISHVSHNKVVEPNSRLCFFVSIN